MGFASHGPASARSCCQNLVTTFLLLLLLSLLKRECRSELRGLGWVCVSGLVRVFLWGVFPASPFPISELEGQGFEDRDNCPARPSGVWFGHIDTEDGLPGTVINEGPFKNLSAVEKANMFCRYCSNCQDFPYMSGVGWRIERGFNVSNCSYFL